MRFRHLILPIVALVGCPTLLVGQLRYSKGQSAYQVGETENEYVVTYFRAGDHTASRNRNIEDRKRRMEAVDLMGAYQLYMAWCDRLGVEDDQMGDLFQIFTDAVGYHYDADVYALRRREERDHTVFTCAKRDFVITEADFPINVDVAGLVRENYNRQKDCYAAATLYTVGQHSSEDYIRMMHDFLSGRASVDGSVRKVQKSGGINRLDNSLYTDLDPMVTVEISGAEMNISLGIPAPFGQFAWVDMVTTAAPADKSRYYEMWKAGLHNDTSLWENLLLWAAQNCTTPLPEEFPTVSEAIAAFPGAISPYGVRLAGPGDLYSQAEAAYAASDTENALRLLHESLSNEGVSKEALNLTGAVCRYTGAPTSGIPYLLLGFMIDPETRFLVGNLVASLDAAGYPRTRELAKFLSSYAKVDSWSRGIIDNIIASEPEELVLE